MADDKPDRLDDPLDHGVNVNFRITERERREFKAWCANRGMSQTEAFKRGFELLKKEDQDGI